MNFNKFYLCTPPSSPLLNDITLRKNDEITNINKSFGLRYPTDNKMTSQDLMMNTISTHLSNFHYYNNSKMEYSTESNTSIYPSLKKEDTDTKKYNKNKNNNKSHKINLETVMENTNLVCSFLKTLCIGIPVDEENGQHEENKTYTSLERFVANIFIYTNIDEIFSYVAMLYVQRYLSIKIKKREAKKKRRLYHLQQKLKIKYINEGNMLRWKWKKMNEGEINHYNLSKNRNNLKIKTSQLISKSENRNTFIPKQKRINTQKDLILAAMICTSKYLDDNSYANIAWVKLTGRDKNEVFELEKEFLTSIDYEIHVSYEDWERWYSWINHFKILLNISMASDTNINESSPSCMITLPSQNSYNDDNINHYNYDNISRSDYYLPSPIETPILSQTSFPVKENEESSLNSQINLNNNTYIPSLSIIESSMNNNDDIIDHDLFQFDSKDYNFDNLSLLLPSF